MPAIAIGAVLVTSLLPLPAPAQSMTVGVCPGAPLSGGCYYDETPQDRDGAVVYIDPSTLADPDYLPIVARHEAGHAFDYQTMNDGQRNAFRTRILRTRLPWRAAPGVRGAEEHFADVYAGCATQSWERAGRWDYWSGAYGREFTGARMRAGCRMIDRIIRQTTTKGE